MDSREANDPIDREVIEELRAGIAPQALLAVIGTFEADAIKRLSEISGAVRGGDGEALKAAAHALKGASANLGAARVSVLSARLWELGRDGDLTSAPAIVDELERAVQDAPAALRDEVSR
jgi:HPt (histidine-containing phosphotransfer) domain-containing protein